MRVFGTMISAQKLFLIGLLALFAAVSVQYTVKVLTPRNGETTRSAIVRWRDQLLQLESGEDIYTRYNYPNPPIMAIMLRPIAELPPLTGALVWYYIKEGLALAAFAMCFRLASDEGTSFPPWARALTVLLTLRPILGDLMHGNVNLLILFLVVTGLFLFRKEWDLSAGVTLALAIACKVTPALFIPYFVWKRAWRVVAGLTLGLGLFLFAIPALALGWSENIELLSSWTRKMVLPFIVGGIVTSEHPNQSLPGLVHRLMTHNPSFSDYLGDQYVVLAYHNIIDIGQAAKWVVKCCFAIFVLVVAWTCRTSTETRRRSALGAEFAIICLGMLLFSERTWKHHAVVLMLPFAVLSYQWAAGQVTGWRRGLVVGSLACSALFMLLTSTAAFPDDWAKLAQVYGAYTCSFVLLMAAQICVLTQKTATSVGVANPQLRAA